LGLLEEVDDEDSVPELSFKFDKLGKFYANMKNYFEVIKNNRDFDTICRNYSLDSNYLQTIEKHYIEVKKLENTKIPMAGKITCDNDRRLRLTYGLRS
jgi:hypothetical protein